MEVLWPVKNRMAHRVCGDLPGRAQQCTARRRRCGAWERRKGLGKSSIGLSRAISLASALVMTAWPKQTFAVVFSKKEIWQENPVSQEVNRINIVLTSSMMISAGTSFVLVHASEVGIGL